MSCDQNQQTSEPALPALHRKRTSYVATKGFSRRIIQTIHADAPMYTSFMMVLYTL